MSTASTSPPPPPARPRVSLEDARARALALWTAADREEGFVPAEALAERLRGLPNTHGYSTLEPGLKAAWRAWENEVGEATASRFNRRVLIGLIAAFDPGRQRQRLPPCIRALYGPCFGSMLDSLGLGRDRGQRRLSIAEDAYLKDLGVAAGLLLPVGSRLVEVDSGWSRRVALAGDAAQLLRCLRLLLGSLGTTRPFYQLHVYLRQLEDFNPEGWRLTLGRLSELLHANPQVKGVFGCAWLYDPQLARVSPRLAYCRELALESGATALRVRADSRSGALERSPTRRRLFEQGQYRPETWLVVWPRRRLIDWAAAQALPAGQAGVC